MNTKYFEIGQDAMQFFRERARRKEKIENLLYLLFCILIAGVFMYQALLSFSMDAIPHSYAEAQQTYSLEGGGK